MIPNAPGDRSHHAPEPPKEVYLVYDNQQHGPYTMDTLFVLQGQGAIPKDALYWRQGIAGARPFSELLDEIKVFHPRQHHYKFAYDWMPTWVFGSEFSHSVCRSTKQQLLQSWAIAGKALADGDLDPPTGLDAELCPFGSDTDLLLITMPAPRRNTEAYFIGIVFPRKHDVSRIRYFILSHSDANERYGPSGSEGCIRELTADGTNYRAKDFIEPFKRDFLAAMLELCSKPPGATACSWIKPPTT